VRTSQWSGLDSYLELFLIISQVLRTKDCVCAYLSTGKSQEVGSRITPELLQWALVSEVMAGRVYDKGGLYHTPATMAIVWNNYAYRIHLWFIIAKDLGFAQLLLDEMCK
jgi:hypothetical protein